MQMCVDVSLFIKYTLTCVYHTHTFILRNNTWSQDGSIALGPVVFSVRLATRASKTSSVLVSVYYRYTFRSR